MLSALSNIWQLLHADGENKKNKVAIYARKTDLSLVGKENNFVAVWITSCNNNQIPKTEDRQ